MGRAAFTLTPRSLVCARPSPVQSSFVPDGWPQLQLTTAAGVRVPLGLHLLFILYLLLELLFNSFCNHKMNAPYRFEQYRKKYSEDPIFKMLLGAEEMA